MSATPRFDACLVCDSIRPELDGKSILLGFLGVCPRVDFGVPFLDKPIAVSFMFSGETGSGTFTSHVAVYDDSIDQILAQSVVQTFEASPLGSTTLIAPFLLTFGHSGTFSIRLAVDGLESFRSTFRVRQGTPR